MPFELIKVHYEPDGTFPNGIPNPLLPENRAATSEAVVSHKADLGIAWDGDFDRCFFFDETGTFIDGYYIVGLLAESILKKNPGAKSIHDPRVIWNTLDMVATSGKTLSELVGDRIAMYLTSGEINREVADAAVTLKNLHERYAQSAIAVDDIDGYSFEFADWRFNIRKSNTEPVVRLNVETRGDRKLLAEKTQEVLEVLEKGGQ